MGKYFTAGEFAAIHGMSKQTLLFYDKIGLIKPAFVDENNRYRYYSAKQMEVLDTISMLKEVGMPLAEIREYYYDTENLDRYLDRLMDLRATLDRNIHLLQLRAAKPGDLSVHRVRLPRQVCFCRRYQCTDAKDAAIKLRDTYIAAARTGKMSMGSRMFTVRAGSSCKELDLLCCIPVSEDFVGEERMEFAEMSALCIYYRGAYEGINTAIDALQAYVQENKIQATGGFHCIYLEGPPNRGDHTEDYITQVALPFSENSEGCFVNNSISPHYPSLVPYLSIMST